MTCLSRSRHVGESKNRGTQNGWFIMENPITMDDLGVPYFWKHPDQDISEKPHVVISGPFRWCPFCWVPLWKTPPPCHLCYLEENEFPWTSMYGIYTYTPWRIGVPTKTTKCRNRYILYMYLNIYIYLHIIWILWVYIFVRDDLQMAAPKKLV